MTDDMWPDEALNTAMLRYIRKHCARQEEWQLTRIGSLHDELADLVTLSTSELVTVSCYISLESWYVLTSRRVVSQNLGGHLDIYSTQVTSTSNGIFKSAGNPKIQKMILHLPNGQEGHIEYETDFAAMAPIYYFIFWNLKFPALFKDVKHP